MAETKSAPKLSYKEKEELRKLYGEYESIRRSVGRTSGCYV